MVNKFRDKISNKPAEEKKPKEEENDKPLQNFLLYSEVTMATLLLGFGIYKTIMYFKQSN